MAEPVLDVRYWSDLTQRVVQYMHNVDKGELRTFDEWVDLYTEFLEDELDSALALANVD